MKVALFLFLACCTTLFAGSVRLINDSPYPLRAAIRGSDGTFLGEMVLEPQHASTWSDSNMGFYGEGNVYQEQPNRAESPYTVLWFCNDGGDFSVCDGVSEGATVTALSCPGIRECKPKKQTPSSSNENEGFLQNEEESEESSVGPPSD